MARLVLLSEGLTGRTYELKTDVTTVGRVADNAFEIPEASVSSHHAEIILRGNEVVIKDLGSTNGTFIAGEKITEAVLKPGQIVRLGTVEMRLESGEAPTSTTKRALDQTRVIPQGVKLDELEGARTPTDFKPSTGFAKKSAKGTKIFVVLAILVAIGLICALGFIVLRHQ